MFRFLWNGASVSRFGRAIPIRQPAPKSFGLGYFVVSPRKRYSPLDLWPSSALFSIGVVEISFPDVVALFRSATLDIFNSSCLERCWRKSDMTHHTAPPTTKSERTAGLRSSTKGRNATASTQVGWDVATAAANETMITACGKQADWWAGYRGMH